MRAPMLLLSSEFWPCQRRDFCRALSFMKGSYFHCSANPIWFTFSPPFWMNQYDFRFRWCYSSQTRSIPAASANNRHPCLTYYSALQTMLHYGRTVPGNINCPWELILSSPPECLPLWYSCLHKNFTARSIPRNQSIFWKHKEYRLDRILKACKIYTYCPSKLTSVIQSFPFADYVCPYTHIFFPQTVTLHTLWEGQEIFSMLFVLKTKGYCLAKDE